MVSNKKLISFLLVLLLPNCSKIGLESDYCLKAFPIYVGEGDIFTDPTAKEILKHDQTWQVECPMRDDWMNMASLDLGHSDSENILSMSVK